MRKISKAVLLAFVLTLALVALPAWATPFAGGSGTSADPFIVTTPAMLDAVRDNLSSHFRLGNDIDLTAYLASGGGGCNAGAGFGMLVLVAALWAVRRR